MGGIIDHGTDYQAQKKKKNTWYYMGTRAAKFTTCWKTKKHRADNLAVAGSNGLNNGLQRKKKTPPNGVRSAADGSKDYPLRIHPQKKNEQPIRLIHVICTLHITSTVPVTNKKISHTWCVYITYIYICDYVQERNIMPVIVYSGVARSTAIFAHNQGSSKKKNKEHCLQQRQRQQRTILRSIK